MKPLTQETAKLQAAQQRYESASQTRRQEIAEQSQPLAELEQKLAAAQQKTSRLEGMIAAEMVRMEPQSKR